MVMVRAGLDNLFKRIQMTSSAFKEAYAVLQHHAQALGDQQDPYLEALLTIVAESAQAYQVCRERIDAVEKLLQKSLPATPAAAREPLRAAWTPTPKAPQPFDGQDLPLPEQARRGPDNIFASNWHSLPVNQLQPRAAHRAGVRLRVKAPV